MKPFMDHNFLLETETSQILYHDYAKDMPIFDYHCHLNPKEIAEDKKYKNITEVWLGGDHYKWRAMRSNGVSEKYITGDAEDKEKFMKWAETVSTCIGNPLYHWTHLELRTYFGIQDILGPETAEKIWEQCNEMLKKDEFSARSFIKRSNVKVVCTTDDPIDDLSYHRQIAEDKDFDVKVLPAFRPDKAINIEKPDFPKYIDKLSKTSNMEISSFSALLEALSKRIEYFHEIGCRISDHALEPPLYKIGTENKADEVFKKALKGKELSEEDIKIFKTLLMLHLGREYKKYGWTMQLHIGTQRNNNTKMLKALGPDTGFDMIADYTYSKDLASLMDALEVEDQLPKTIIYCLNPRDNEMIGTLIGCFQDGSIPGKIQFGSGWWFNDQKDGMIRQMTALANLGLLSKFVGMLTDSRSFLSYTRHEYFRRILCNLIGGWVENGEFPKDIDLLGKIVQDICFNNAANYFGI